MFESSESKLILKLPPFSLTYTVREKRRQFQDELTLKHSEVILELSCFLGSSILFFRQKSTADSLYFAGTTESW